MPSTIFGCVSPKVPQPILANPLASSSLPARNGRDRRVDEVKAVHLGSSTDTWQQIHRVWLEMHRSWVVWEPVRERFVGEDQGYP